MSALLLALPLLFVVLRYSQQRRRKTRSAVTLFSASHCCAINRRQRPLDLTPRRHLPPITQEDHL